MLQGKWSKGKIKEDQRLIVNKASDRLERERKKERRKERKEFGTIGFLTPPSSHLVGAHQPYRSA